MISLHVMVYNKDILNRYPYFLSHTCSSVTELWQNSSIFFSKWLPETDENYGCNVRTMHVEWNRGAETLETSVPSPYKTCFE